MKTLITFLTIFLTFFSLLNAQQQEAQLTINWEKETIASEGVKLKEFFYTKDIEINGVKYDEGFRIVYPLSPWANQFEIISFKALEFASEVHQISSLHKERISANSNLIYAASIRTMSLKKYLFIDIATTSLHNGATQRIKRLDLKFTTSTKKDLTTRTFANQSVLSSGTWYKVGITKSGVYELTGADLINHGFDLTSISPSNIRIFGNGGGQLPYLNCAPRVDDLKELAIELEGTQDGTFDSQDKILFFAKSQSRATIDSNALWQFDKNYYDDTTYYFLNFDQQGRRILEYVQPGTFTSTINSYDQFIRFEQDLENLIGSGKEWYGDKFDIKTSRDYKINIPNYSPGSTINFKAALVARSINTNSTFTVLLDNTISESKSFGSVGPEYTDTFAKESTIEKNIQVSGDILNINLEFIKAASNSIGWLDYLEIRYKGDLKMTQDQLIFQNLHQINTDAQKIVLNNLTGNETIWDITNHFSVKKINFNLNGNIAEYVADRDSIHRYVCFNSGQAFKIESFTEISNQNLHALSGPDLIIVTPQIFINQAEQLAEFRRDNDGLIVEVVDQEMIYNEFSGGGRDITAIKDFLKMFYDRSQNGDRIPKYVLLMGDGTYDNIGINKSNKNLIPTYQSNNSLSPLGSYTSDDYIGLLDDDESDLLSDLVDIGIGRFPVKTADEALKMVDKTIRYYDSRSFANWRQKVILVADDGQPNEGVSHMSDADAVADLLELKYPDLNIKKVYLDAHEQETSAGGQRFPVVKDKINKSMEKGNLIIHYAGHGGQLGWTHERVLEISDIRSWTNQFRMPIMITATCEFSRFDNPDRTSAGELVILNPEGGAVGLFTTTRLVYGNPNKQLALNFYKSLNLDDSNNSDRLGDFASRAKFLGPHNINSRNFTLLGDPSLKLSYPIKNAVTTLFPDTIRALEKVSMEGMIAEDNGNLISDYNGEVTITVFDKHNIVKTLNNDGEGVFTYDAQDNVIFKGKSVVKNGRFSYSFVVPKDIRADYGLGKISYYAKNNLTSVDAGGHDSIVIGGINPNAPIDIEGPIIDLFMNDESFVNGGTTDESPALIVNIYDESGINTVGNGIGHDLTVTLDNDKNNLINLNEDYEAALNDFQNGQVKYKFNDLEEGQHSLTVKAWDVYNNSSEESLEFFVANSEEIVLNHILNYPNPFTTNTSFYFEHNQPNSNLAVSIDVFTVSGHLIKSFRIDEFQKGNRFGPIPWDGLDEFGDPLGKGVYVYRVGVIAPNGSKAQEFEKLVLLN